MVMRRHGQRIFGRPETSTPRVIPKRLVLRVVSFRMERHLDRSYVQFCLSFATLYHGQCQAAPAHATYKRRGFYLVGWTSLETNRSPPASSAFSVLFRNPYDALPRVYYSLRTGRHEGLRISARPRHISSQAITGLLEVSSCQTLPVRALWETLVSFSAKCLAKAEIRRGEHGYTRSDKRRKWKLFSVPFIV